jgi:hypothetical protein
LIAELVNQGLATLTAEKVRAGGKLIAVAKARITDAGRGRARSRRLTPDAHQCPVRLDRSNGLIAIHARLYASA